MAENTSVKGISNPKQRIPTRALKTIHIKKHEPETSSVFTAKIRFTVLSIAQKSPGWGGSA